MPNSLFCFYNFCIGNFQINCNLICSRAGDKCPENHAGCTIAVPCLPGLTNQSCGTDFKKGMMVAESAMRASNANTSGNCTNMVFFYKEGFLCVRVKAT